MSRLITEIFQDSKFRQILKIDSTLIEGGGKYAYTICSSSHACNSL